MNIYVGNLSFEASEDDLRKAFEEFGTVANVTILKDKFSGKSKGFGFVTMADEETAQKAIAEMNGKELEGRALTVSVARPPVERPNRG